MVEDASEEAKQIAIDGFRELCIHCASNQELVREFDRLNGTNLSEIGRRSPIAAMIDEATGRDADTMRKFMTFVYECVVCRLNPQK